MPSTGFLLGTLVLCASVAHAQYITGPRGGCYTLTKSGTKRYVDHSFCAPAAKSAPVVTPSSKPSEAPRAGTSAKPQLIVTSNPTGAEIEVNGEYAGNTPSTLSAAEGKVTIKVTKSGYQPWLRTLTLASGDKRTISVEMTK